MYDVSLQPADIVKFMVLNFIILKIDRRKVNLSQYIYKISW